MRRGFVTCTVATFLAMSPFTAAQEQRTVLPGADLTISVHDYANVSDASLASAIAQRVKHLDGQGWQQFG